MGYLNNAVCISATVLSLTACSHSVLAGHALSARFDPQRVSGLAVSDGPSGPRSDAPGATRTVLGTDGGQNDKLAALGVTDIEAFWKVHYPKAFGQPFNPVKKLVSADGDDPSAPTECGSPENNAAYCRLDDSISWDRSERSGLLPIAQKYFGPIAVVGVLAHEYGHAVQSHAGLPKKTATIVKEQQADCYAGTYMRWVAEGNSPRFVLSTADGINHLLAGLLAIRDPIDPEADPDDSDAHGTGLDRISAFQVGFELGPKPCAAITKTEIAKRRGDLPRSLFAANGQNSDVALDKDTLATLAPQLQKIFQPTKAPTFTTGSASCDGKRSAQAASYCPSSNTVAVDLPALQQLGSPASESEHVLLQGDNTAISLLVSRYVLALQQQRGLPLDNPHAAMRTACLTGVAQRKMAQPTSPQSTDGLTLGAGDLDEAIAGLLTNGGVASDVNGAVLPAGFTRVSAFRAGLLGDVDDCFRRF